MPAYPQLRQPPIVEAQLNFQTDASLGWKQFGTPEHAPELFPSHSEVQALQQFVFQTNPSQASVTSGVHGFFLRRPGEPTVYQVRRDGFAFSRLHPYEGWESFAGPALEGWERYEQQMQPGELNGISLRYINRLEVPRIAFVSDRDRFLTIAPRVPYSDQWMPEGTTWGFAAFSHHAVFLPVGGRFQIAVSLARDPADIDPDVAAILLDITVSPISGSELTKDGLDSVLEEMRNLKNQAFFSITTEASRSRYS